MEYSIIIITIVFLLLLDISILQTRVNQMNSTLYKIAKHVGIPELCIDDDLIALIKDGKKIKAIKKLRMATGLGLKEAKEYVDSLELKSSDITSDKEI